MTRIINSILCIALVSFGSGTSLLAQDNTGLTQQINVVKAFQPTLSDAFKINASPAGDTNTYKNPVLKYALIPYSMAPIVDVEPVKPFKLKDEPIAKYYRGYGRFAIGNYMLPKVDFYYNSLRAENYAAGIKLGYENASFKPSTFRKADYSLLNVETFATKYFSKAELGLNVNYQNSERSLYGRPVNTGSLLDYTFANKRNSTDLFQLQTYGGNKTKNEEDVKYSGGLGYQRFNLNKSVENTITLNGNASNGIGTGVLGLGFSLDASSGNLRKKDFSRSLTVFNPYWTLNEQEYRIRIGLKIGIEGGLQSKGYFLPDIQAQYELSRNYAIGFFEANGTLQKNNLKDLAGLNPFLTDSMLMRTTSAPINVKVGLKGNLNANWSYLASVGYQQISNEVFWALSPQLNYANAFLPYFDKANLVQVNLETGYGAAEKYGVNVRVVINQYKTDTLSAAWHKNQMQFQASGFYNLGHKLIGHMSFNIINGRKAPVNDSWLGQANTKPSTVVAKDLGIITDLNLGIEYRYSKRVGAFLQFNNIAASHYQYFSNYPVVGFQALIGAHFSF